MTHKGNNMMHYYLVIEDKKREITNKLVLNEYEVSTIFANLNANFRVVSLKSIETNSNYEKLLDDITKVDDLCFGKNTDTNSKA